MLKLIKYNVTNVYSLSHDWIGDLVLKCYAFCHGSLDEYE